MLTALRIRNLALVTDLTLDLQPGYNVITGETGAGKSIIIGALNLLLGQRADRSLIRSGSDACAVEAVFSVASLRQILAPWLERNGLEACEGDQLLLKRSFSSTGTNRQFVNGSPATLQMLAQLGEWLVDMHGPHEHQSLLQPAKQLLILDAFGKLDAHRESFAALTREHERLDNEKCSLIVDEQTYAQQLDLLRHQVREIESARLAPEEDVRVEEEYARSHNAARLLELSQTALTLLSDDEHSLVAQAGMLGLTLSELRRLDSRAEELFQTHEQITTSLRELHLQLSHYAERIDLDPGRLRELEDRLNLLQSLKRKYGTTLSDVIAFGSKAREKLEALEQRDTALERINTDLEKVEAKIRRAGQELSRARRKIAPKLAAAIARHLSDLGFRRSSFEIQISTSDPTVPAEYTAKTTGFDQVEFQFSPNSGESARPLRAIASSGEIARVMLAIKTVLAVEDQIPVLVFDEIDSHVGGGETAKAVGEKMLQIGRQRQVLCITHLAPVAAAAPAHFVVTKDLRGDRTVSDIRLLDRAERVAELSRMLGGQTAAAQQHAEELLG